MDRETALRILRELIADYYSRGGTQLSENVSRKAANFHEWLLRHVVADMLNRREQWVAVYSTTQIDRVVFHSVQEYTTWTNGGATVVRMQFVARAGCSRRAFTLHAVLQGNGCGFHIDTGRHIGLTVYGAVAADGSVTTTRAAVAPRRPRRPRDAVQAAIPITSALARWPELPEPAGQLRERLVGAGIGGSWATKDPACGGRS